MEETTNLATTVEPQQGNSDIIGLITTVWQRRKVFYWLWPITFVLSAALILCVPRYYTCEVILAPEMQTNGASGSLQSLASSFGFDMRNMSNADAIYPLIYPDVVESPNFLVKLFDVPVATSDRSFEGTYYNYLINKHRQVFLKRWKSKIMAVINPPEPLPILDGKRPASNGVDVFCMGRLQWYAIWLMRDNISCSVDKKTEVITFSVTAQDKLVCATMADSVCAALQSFIIDYRTIKSRTDIAYYEEMMRETYRDYQQASERYINYVDGHKDMFLEKYRIEAQDLEGEMQLKYSAYTSFQKQYLATQARLQENTPVFTVLQSASVPLKPAGPKRTIFVLAMLILATGIAFCVVCKNQLIQMMRSNDD